MTARCDLTELLVTDCAHCRGLEPAVLTGQPEHAIPTPIPGPWFTARYGGECDGCSNPIIPGEPIRSDGEGGWLGECCGED